MYNSGILTNPISQDDFTLDISDYNFFEKEDNRIFLRKIYILLLYQLSITIGMCIVPIYYDTVQKYIISHNGPFIAGICLSFLFIFLLYLNKDNYPSNLRILTGLTISIGYTVSVTCAIYVSHGYKILVIKSFLITILTFIILTIFTYQSKYNFDFMKDIIIGGLFVIIFWGIINWIIDSNGGKIYSFFGIFIFVCLIIYDTHRLKDKYASHDYILASVNLYLDIINLFLYILDYFRTD